MYIIKEMPVTAYPQVIVGSHQLKCGGEQLSNSCDFLQVVCRPENFITKEEPYLESKKKKKHSTNKPIYKVEIKPQI